MPGGVRTIESSRLRLLRGRGVIVRPPSLAARAASELPEAGGSANLDSTALPSSFCIIEDRTTVQDFAKLQMAEIKTGIRVSCRGWGAAAVEDRPCGRGALARRPRGRPRGGTPFAHRGNVSASGRC